MRLEEIVEDDVELTAVFLHRKVEFDDVDGREVVAHIVAESHLAVVLLFRGHLAVFHQFQQHDFLLFRGDEHEHLRSEVAALERVLSEETQRSEVGHIGVEQDERHVLLVELVGKLLCDIEFAGYDDDAVGQVAENVVGHAGKRTGVEAFVVYDFHLNVEVASCLGAFQCTFLNFLPVGLTFVFRHEECKLVGLVVSQGCRVHIGLVVDFLQHLLHLFPCRFRHIRAIVEDSVHGSYRDSREFCNVLDSDVICHVCCPLICTSPVFRLRTQ